MDAGNGPSVPGSLRFLTGPLVGNAYQVTKSIIHLGREPGNDVVISDPSVSRHHAEISWNNGVWSIKKLASQNILTINQKDIQQVAPLNDGDTIGFGAQTTCLFLTNISNGVRPSQQTPAAKMVSLHGSPPPPPPPVTPFIPPEPGRGAIASTERVSLSGIQNGVPGQSRPGSGVGVPTLEVSTNVDTGKASLPIDETGDQYWA